MKLFFRHDRRFYEANNSENISLINTSLSPGPMRGFWCHRTVWRTSWWRWVWSSEEERKGAAWCRPWAASATTRKLSPSRTSVSRRPWTATTWSRWTPTQRRATTATAAPPPCRGWACTGAGTRTGATPTPGGLLSPTSVRTPSNSCTSSPEEGACRDCGLGVRTRWQFEKKKTTEDEKRKRKKSWSREAEVVKKLKRQMRHLEGEDEQERDEEEVWSQLAASPRAANSPLPFKENLKASIANWFSLRHFVYWKENIQPFFVKGKTEMSTLKEQKISSECRVKAAGCSLWLLLKDTRWDRFVESSLSFIALSSESSRALTDIYLS